MKTKNEIKAEATKIKGMGSHRTIEELIAFITKKEENAAKRDKRNNKKWADRIERKKMVFEPINDMHAYNRANALKNLPSSMR